MDFTVINRMGGQRSVWIYNTNDVLTPGWDSPRGNGLQSSPDFWVSRPAKKIDIDNNQMWGLDLPYSNYKFYLQGAETVGPFNFPAQTPLIMTQSPQTKQSFLDLSATLTALDADLNGKVNDIPPPVSNDPNVSQIFAAIGSALFSALTSTLSGLSGVAGLGGVAGFGAGDTSLVGSLVGSLGASYPAAEVPQGPSLASIKAAVSDAMNKNNAAVAGSYVQALYLWFTRKAKEIDFFQKQKKPVPKRLETDFLSEVKYALDPRDSSSFYSTLFYVSANSDVAKYMLREFLIGIGLYIHLRRIDLGQTYIPYALTQKTEKGVMPPSEIGDLKADIGTMRDGFDKGRTAFGSMRSGIVQNYGLSGIPEAIFILRKVSKFYLGDTNAVQDAAYITAYPNGAMVSFANAPGWLWDEKGYDRTSITDPIARTYESLNKAYAMVDSEFKAVTAGGWPSKLLAVDWSALLAAPV